MEERKLRYAEVKIKDTSIEVYANQDEFLEMLDARDLLEFWIQDKDLSTCTIFYDKDSKYFKAYENDYFFADEIKVEELIDKYLHKMGYQKENKDAKTT